MKKNQLNLNQSIENLFKQDDVISLKLLSKQILNDINSIRLIKEHLNQKRKYLDSSNDILNNFHNSSFEFDCDNLCKDLKVTLEVN